MSPRTALLTASSACLLGTGLFGITEAGLGSSVTGQLESEIFKDKNAKMCPEHLYTNDKTYMYKCKSYL